MYVKDFALSIDDVISIVQEKINERRNENDKKYIKIWRIKLC